MLHGYVNIKQKFDVDIVMLHVGIICLCMEGVEVCHHRFVDIFFPLKQKTCINCL